MKWIPRNVFLFLFPFIQMGFAVISACTYYLRGKVVAFYRNDCKPRAILVKSKFPLQSSGFCRLTHLCSHLVSNRIELFLRISRLSYRDF